MVQCQARTRRGKRCRAAALRGSDFCFTHSPQTSEARQVARRKGGHNRKTAVRLSGEAIEISSMADVLKLLNAIVVDTWQQDNGAARSRVLLACCETGIKALTATDLEQRVEALERLRRIGYEPRAAA